MRARFHRSFWLAGVLGILVQAAGGAAAPATPTAPAALPPALEAALQGAEGETEAGWAYTQSIRVFRSGELVESRTVRIDPGQPADRRCVVLHATGEKGAADADKQDSACADDHDFPSYARLAEMIRDGKVTPVAGGAQGANFRLEPRPGRTLRMTGVDVQISSDETDDLTGTAHVAQAGEATWVDRLRLGLPGARGNAVARLHQLDLDYHYARDAATGMRLPAAFDIALRLTLVGLWTLDIRVEQRFSDFRKVAGAPAGQAQAHPHAHPAGAAAGLQLDAGRKWGTDAALRAGMAAIQRVFEADHPAIHSGAETDAQYAALAGRIETQVQSIVANCRLPPAADANLHLVIADLLQGVAMMRGQQPARTRHDGAALVHAALQAYAKHFDDPGLAR